VSRRATWSALAACAAAGTLVRAIPCRSDFWLDEIWTYYYASALSSPLGVFTGIHHSNNHHLNTLLFYLLGDQREWAVYRVPSLLAGTGSLVLAGLLGARRGRLEAVLATGLCSASFALIHFSSEARGYSLAVCFALAALASLLRFLERRRGAAAELFAACTVLGILSQLVFVCFWAGAIALSALRLARHPGTPWAALRDALRLHAAPALALLLLYQVDLRHLAVGGGPPPAAGEIAVRVVGFSLGLPVREALAPAYAALALGILFLGLRLLWRDGDELWLLFLVAIALAPAAVLAALRPEVIDLRYFLIGIALFLILLAWVIGAGLRAGGLPRAAASLGLAVFLVGNGVHTARFLELGRGGFRAALLYMAEHTEGPRVVVGSDQDFRNGIVLRFYARFLPAGKTLDYRNRRGWARDGPEWIVLHRRARPSRPLAELDFEGVGRYRLVAEFDHGAISGFYWGVYRSVGAGGGSPSAEGGSGRAPSGAGPPSLAGASRRARRITTPKPSGPKGSGPMRATRV
jgi:hypothetical protein